MNRYRFPIAILILSVMTFGLVFTASPAPDAQAAPRSIPWDCSDWQETPAVADADDARVSMILESLAANRGKSIYCAIDQSDTWTKTETWEAGRYRNERDDTVYFGEQGNFRGFLAAQEGYLTDGESGVTGVSRDLIFEFPREERRGKKTVRFRVRSDSADTGTCITPHTQTLSELTPVPPGTLICSNLHGSWSGSWVTNRGSGVQHRARNVYVGRGAGDTDYEFDWRTRVRTYGTTPPTVAGGSSLSEAAWLAKAEAAAISACRARGGKYVEGSADFGPGHNRESGEGSRVQYMGPNHGWFYDYRRQSESGLGNNANAYQAKARESRTWSGVCTKRVRRR